MSATVVVMLIDIPEIMILVAVDNTMVLSIATVVIRNAKICCDGECFVMFMFIVHISGWKGLELSAKC